MPRQGTITAAALAALLGGVLAAHAQYPGQIPNNTVIGNVSGTTAPARPVPMGSLTTLCGAGTTNRVIKFNASDVCVDSNISDDGSGTAITFASGGALHTTVTQAAGGGNFNATLGSGSGAASNGGSFNLLAGNAGTSGSGGSLTLTSGGTASGTSGAITLNIGESVSGNAGSYVFNGGTVTAGNGSSYTVNLSLGAGGGTNGQFKITNLPTSDPSVADALWSSTGFIIKSGSSFTSGGVPYFNSGSTVASSGALTANAPVIGGGAGAAPSSGTRSGNTTTFATTTGSLTSGNVAAFDASGNIVDGGVLPGTQRLAIGWDPALDPAGNVIATVDQASTVRSLVGTVVVAVGATATLSVYKAGSGVACGSGTVLHSGSFNANGTANTNQTLTLTTTALSAGDRVCLVTSDTANWTGGVGMGGITARITTP